MISEKETYEQQYQKYIEYLDSLFGRAYKSQPLELLFALLRVDGLADPDWDPFEESQKSFKDFNWLIQKANEDLSDISSSRIALLMYCQAIEMTAPHILLFNLLNIIAGNPYKINPFFNMSRPKKKGFLSWVPPSATKKMNCIKKLAEDINERELVEIINSFFDDRIRNAFSHSDYIITKEYFRWTEGGPASQISMPELENKIRNCYAFYGALLENGPRWRRGYGTFSRYHKLPRYEILELQKDSEGLVDGFKIHFSNGSYASYSRSAVGSKPMNIRINNEGSIDFFVGEIDKLEKVWKINGEPVNDLNKLNESN